MQSMDDVAWAEFGIDPTIDAARNLGVAVINEGWVQGAGKAADELGATLKNEQATTADILNATRAAALDAGIGAKALRFLDDLFEPDDVIEITAMRAGGHAADPNTRVSVYGRLGNQQERARLSAFIERHWLLRNLYWGVCPRSTALLGSFRAARADQIASRHLVPFDHDMPGNVEDRKGWEQDVLAVHAGMPVGAAVRSGGGLQVFVLIEKVIGHEAVSAGTGQLNAINARHSSDRVGDGPRVMRLPFTVNIPTPNKIKRGRTLALSTVYEATP